MNSESAYQTLSMMRSVVTNGSGQRANVRGLEIVVKQEQTKIILMLGLWA